MDDINGIFQTLDNEGREPEKKPDAARSNSTVGQLLNQLDAVGGRPEWSDPQVPVEQKVSSFLATHDAAGTPSEEVGKQGEETLGVPSAYLRQHYDLMQAKKDVAGQGVGPVTAFLRKSVPYFSDIREAGQMKDYQESQARLAAGQASKEDIQKIATVERLQDIDRQMGQSFVGQLTQAAAGIPKVVGEFGVAGKALGMAGGVGKGLLGYTAGRAATTPLMPSLWLNQAVQKNVQEGRSATDLRGFAPAAAKGFLDNMVLGSLQPAAQAIPGGAAARLAGAGGLFVGEQAGADVLASVADEFLPKAYKTDTGYGLIGEGIKDVRAGKGVNDVFTKASVQAITGALFAGMHGRDPDIAAFQDASRYLKKQGYSRDGAGKILSNIGDVIDAAQAKDPNVSAEQLNGLMTSGLKDSPVKDYAQKLIEQKTANAKPASQGEPLELPQDTLSETDNVSQPEQSPQTPEEQAVAANSDMNAAHEKLREATQRMNSLRDAATMPVASPEVKQAYRQASKDYAAATLEHREAVKKAQSTREAVKPPEMAQESTQGTQAGESASQPADRPVEAKSGGPTAPEADAVKRSESLAPEETHAVVQEAARQTAAGVSHIPAEQVRADISRVESEARAEVSGTEHAGRRPDALAQAHADEWSRLRDAGITGKEVKVAEERLKKLGAKQSPETVGMKVKVDEAEHHVEPGGGTMAHGVITRRGWTDKNGVTLAKPRVRRLGRQHELQAYEDARANAGKGEKPASEDLGDLQGEHEVLPGDTDFNPAELERQAPPVKSRLMKLADRLEAEASANLKKKLGDNLFAGFDPTLIPDLAKFVAAKIIKGGYTLAQFTKDAAGRFGDAIKPHLDAIWKGANDIVNSHTTGIKNAVVNEERAERGWSELQAESGTPDKDVVAAARDKLQADPGAADKLVAELIDKPRNLEPEEVGLLLNRKVELENARNESLGRLGEARATGDPESIAEAEDHDATVRSQLDTFSQAVRNAGGKWSQSGRLRQMLLREDYSVANVVRDFEVKNGGQSLSEAERKRAEELAGRLQQTQKRVEELQDELKRLKESKSKPRPEPKSPSLPKEVHEPVRPAPEKRSIQTSKELDKALGDFLKAVKLAPSNPFFDPKTLQEFVNVSRAAIKHGIAKVADLYDAVSDKLGRPLNDNEKKAFDKAWEQAHSDIQSEYIDQQAKFQEALAEKKAEEIKFEQAHDTRVKKVMRTVGNAIDFQRAWMLGGDLPPIFRQGMAFTVSHPVASIKAMLASAKAFKSSFDAHRERAEIADRPNARNGNYSRDMNLNLSDIHGVDEFLNSSWIKKVPIFRNLERWHSAYLTRIRADYYDMLSAGLSKSGEVTSAEGKVIGNAVNVFTGKGDLGAAEKSLGILNKVFLAPSWAVSRYQTAIGQPLWKSGGGPAGRARRVLAGEYLRMGVGVGGILGMAALAGLKVQTDDTAGDFGKITVGNTRLDATASIANIFRLLGRATHGKQSTGDLLEGEVRPKLAPIPAALWNERDIQNKKAHAPYPKTTGEAATNMAMPLTVKDFKDASKDLGLPFGALVGLWASLGGGANTYETKKK